MGPDSVTVSERLPSLVGETRDVGTFAVQFDAKDESMAKKPGAELAVDRSNSLSWRSCPWNSGGRVPRIWFGEVPRLG